ncbi:MAG: Glycerol kinase 2 [Candidatus Nomurabacteria bacterium GW2011_GWA1_46_11]|uniref:glycerol kinase n=2 Tax=Parcubacteria group TaxID=1794811 RepID=A0A1G1YYU3_9BACT|nr:MAG: Glycerol kinase 2 [Parcubacteria group bacterium GW2011_GWA2_46_10]KKU21276.1 MAG: Glycerol kinase 2 [Candidatus Nomurabacteria bacterium GW2011_GWA1_46_11]OGY56577.1 MAG: hypothetical protein A2119_01600 [Candidatus Colwellbacteria bacterium GWA2_46_10]
MKSNFLVLDVGTTGVKGFVFDRKLKLLGKSYHRLNKRFPKKGWVEQSPQDLINKSVLALRGAVKKSKVSPTSLISLGITNQRETTILWDKRTAKPIYPAIVWEDTRTTARTKTLGRKYQSIVREKTGLPIDPYFSATKIAWILENVPRAKTLAEKNHILFGTVDTWVLWNLSREKNYLTDYTNASRTLIFNIKKLVWDQGLLDIFKIPKDILPGVRPSGSLFGHLKSNVIGVSLPIRAICGDQQASMYAAGTKPRTTKITYGTGTFMMQIIGSKFIQHKPFFTTLTATTSKPMYALEGKIDCCGNKVDELLKKKLSLVPILSILSKQVAAKITKLPYRPKELIVDGGLTQAPALPSIQSEAAGIPVIKQSIYDGTGLGIAKLLKSLN